MARRGWAIGDASAKDKVLEQKQKAPGGGGAPGAGRSGPPSLRPAPRAAREAARGQPERDLGQGDPNEGPSAGQKAFRVDGVMYEPQDVEHTVGKHEAMSG
eukprot:gene1451-1110_t